MRALTSWLVLRVEGTRTAGSRTYADCAEPGRLQSAKSKRLAGHMLPAAGARVQRRVHNLKHAMAKTFPVSNCCASADATRTDTPRREDR